MVIVCQSRPRDGEGGASDLDFEMGRDGGGEPGQDRFLIGMKDSGGSESVEIGGGGIDHAEKVRTTGRIDVECIDLMVGAIAFPKEIAGGIELCVVSLVAASLIGGVDRPGEVGNE